MASIEEEEKYTSYSVDSFYDDDSLRGSQSFRTLEEAEDKFEELRRKGSEEPTGRGYEMLLVKWWKGHAMSYVRRSKWKMNTRRGRMEEERYDATF